MQLSSFLPSTEEDEGGGGGGGEEGEERNVLSTEQARIMSALKCVVS